MWKYLRFGYFHWIWFILGFAGLLAGGAWTWVGAFYPFVVGVGGEVLTRNMVDDSAPEYGMPIINDLIVYSCFIGLVAALVLSCWTVAGTDLLGIGGWVNGQIANMGYTYDVLAERDSNLWYHNLGTGITLGGMLGVTGVAAAHELAHRTANPLDLWVGRWTFALSAGTNFATEHVYGHHKDLGHPDIDPVTPKRGVGFYEFLTIGQVRQWKNGFGVETKRLRALGKSTLSIHNRVLHAYARGILVGALVFLAAGLPGLGIWAIGLAYSKYILEGLNFFSHYGMVREDGQPITIRHTFSSYNPLSNHFLFNLGRHGAHHAYDKDYHLLPFEKSPTSQFGYLTMTVISWVPPLFWKSMIPVLKDWEENWATPGERAIVAQQNQESGVPALANSNGQTESGSAATA
jgi:hypothetical protein